MFGAAHPGPPAAAPAPADPAAAAAVLFGRGCRHPGCTQLAATKGLCLSHGGGKVCSSPGCTSKAQSGSQYCRRHGGSKRCTVEGCERVDVGGGLCRAHGGGKRCAVCGKAAVSGGKCVAHGGGKRCQYAGCEKGAQGQSDFCKAHGGGRRCKVENCNKGAQGSSEYCIAHGGGTRCKMDGCTKLARRKGLCQTHLRTLAEEAAPIIEKQAMLPPATKSQLELGAHETKPLFVPSGNAMLTLADVAVKAASLADASRNSLASDEGKQSSDGHSHISPRSDSVPSTVANMEGLEVELLVHVPDMSCMASCGTQVEHVLHTLPFVKQTAVDISKKIVRVVCTTEPAFEGDLAANGLLEPGLHESLVQERFVRFSKSRFAIISTNLDTIGFQSRLIQVYKVVRTQAFDAGEAATSDLDDPSMAAKRRRTESSSPPPPSSSSSFASSQQSQPPSSHHHQQQQQQQSPPSPNWLISTALGLLQTSCMMRFGRDCTCGDDCQCERCPKHPKETHRSTSDLSPPGSDHASETASFEMGREEDYLDFCGTGDFGDFLDIL